MRPKHPKGRIYYFLFVKSHIPLHILYFICCQKPLHNTDINEHENMVGFIMWYQSMRRKHKLNISFMRVFLFTTLT